MLSTSLKLFADDCILQYRSKVTSHSRYTRQLDTLYSRVMLKIRVRVELKSRESNDLLVRVIVTVSLSR